MSKLADAATGEDYPEAARRHLDDADYLYGGDRYDSTSYHAAITVETSLKSAILVGLGAPAPLPRPYWGHDLSTLRGHVLTVALAAFGKSGTMLGALPSSYPNFDARVGSTKTWTDMRYRGAGVHTKTEAAEDLATARLVYRICVAQARLDGKL